MKKFLVLLLLLCSLARAQTTIEYGSANITELQNSGAAGISPAFTSSSSFFCVANDITTRANPVQAIPASGSTVTITNTTGATDNISFFCAGN